MRENLKWHEVVPLWGVEMAGTGEIYSNFLCQSAKRLEVCRKKYLGLGKSEVRASHHISNAQHFQPAELKAR